MAERVSLSPNFSISRISWIRSVARHIDTRGPQSHTETAIVSFSFTIGITPILNSSVNVFCAFKYCVRSAMSFLVRRIWATGCCRCPNKVFHSPINWHWPTLARAYKIVSVLSLKQETRVHACLAVNDFGRFSTFIRRSPIPTAPEETMATLWPSLTNLTAVSTIRDSTERSGS